MGIIQLLLVATIASIIPGQLVRLTLGSSAAVTVSDILALTTDAFFLIQYLYLRKRIKFPTTSFAFLLFSIWACTSIVLSLNFFSTREVLVSSLFLLRFSAYYFLCIVAYNTIKRDSIIKWTYILLTIGFIFALIGFVQLILLPDLSALAPYGWDPHQRRIVATFLDPNFSGGALIIFFSLALSLFLFKKRAIFGFLGLIFFISLVFTSSRSTYLGFLATILTIGLIKSTKTLLFFLIFFLLSIVAIGQVRSRIIGAFTIDETASARLESWKIALKIYGQNPLFGVGFNTYRFAQASYGNFTLDNPQGGHSGAGADSSILLVLATTGTFGLLFYLGFLTSVFKNFTQKVKSSYMGLSATASLIGLFVHSQFVNSMFFPQIMVLLFLLLGLSLVENQKKNS